MKVQVIFQTDLPDPPRGTDELYAQAPGGPSWQDAWAAQKIYDGIIKPAVAFHGMEIINLPSIRSMPEELKRAKRGVHDFWMDILSDPETILQTHVIQ